MRAHLDQQKSKSACDESELLLVCIYLQVLAWSPYMQKAKKLLNEDEDAYAMVRTSAAKWIDVQLSEDIMIDALQLLNRELYSSPIREFHLLGANKYPAHGHWKFLGRFQMANHRIAQHFVLPPPLHWVRFLKLRIVSLYDNDYAYCTLTSLEVRVCVTSYAQPTLL